MPSNLNGFPDSLLHSSEWLHLVIDVTGFLICRLIFKPLSLRAFVVGSLLSGNGQFDDRVVFVKRHLIIVTCYFH